MDTKINFTKIGLFVIALFMLMLGFIFWLGKFGFEKQKFDQYTIYFTESISGLSIESPIKFRGFEVGRVYDIQINPKNSEEIKIDINIKKGTPIKEDNVAELKSLGLTGLRYIELRGGSQSASAIQANSDGIKVIPSKTSVVATLEESTESIALEVTEILNQTKQLLSEKNVDTVSKSMQNIEHLSHYLVNKEAQLDVMFKEITNLSQTSSASFANMSEAAVSLKTVSDALLLEIKKGSFDIKDVSQESFIRLNKALNTLDKTLLQTQELVGNLNESPSDILFKEKTIKYGPGE